MKQGIIAELQQRFRNHLIKDFSIEHEGTTEVLVIHLDGDAKLRLSAGLSTDEEDGKLIVRWKRVEESGMTL